MDRLNDRQRTLSIFAREPDRRRARMRGAAASAALAALVSSCGMGGSGSGAGAVMELQEVSNGFGRLLPHEAFKLENGLPTLQIVALRSWDDVVANVSATNPILPSPEWPVTTTLPNGAAGNQFIYARFNQAIDVSSVLDPAANAAVNSNLLGTISIEATDPLIGTTSSVKGRAFIGGKSYAGVDPLDATKMAFQSWVVLDSTGKPIANPAVDNDGDLVPDGLGFPGTEDLAGFVGAADLVRPDTFVFVVDQDGDLTTHETFAAGAQIRMRVATGVKGTNGKFLGAPALAASTVGEDDLSPEVSQSPPPFSVVEITPGNGEADVDPLSNITVKFTEPIQPTTLGPLLSNKAPTLSGAVTVQFGPSANVVTMPFSVFAPSVYDLSVLELVPAFNFPGAGPTFASCGSFSQVTVTVNAQQFEDFRGNKNTLGPTTFFDTGEGPGIVNAPVMPDVIYVGRGGAAPGISVVDLNGFGASTGNPTYNILTPIIEGNSNYPNNPNVAVQGALLVPALKGGSCTIDGGSAGVFTLTKDSSLNDKLATSPILESVGDMMIGHALDSTFNNGPPPFGCQAGGGNICAQSGLKQPNPVQSGAYTLGPAAPGQFGSTTPGAENLISWAPHPNPPPLVFPPLCISPYIGGQEPTSTNTLAVPPAGPGLTNLLAPGSSPLGQPSLNIPPQGLLVKEQNAFFLGPTPPQTQISACLAYQQRQQIGHFLYVIDRVRSEVVVLNSNRFTLIDRIALPDPTSLAMAPTLELLAVTNQNANQVSFIDIDPSSSTFHQVIKITQVGQQPRGIAWQPGNEDILVCNEGDNTVSIISAFSLEPRKVLKSKLNQPFDVIAFNRQAGFAFLRNVYWAYILNRDGTVAMFESGPDGVNGWGYDDVIGSPAWKFKNPRAIAPDASTLFNSCWIVHEGQLSTEGVPTGKTGPAVSHLVIESTTFGQIPLNLTGVIQAQLRDVNFKVDVSIGSDQLTGPPADIAFDDQMNVGAVGEPASAFGAGVPAPYNGKGLVKFGNFQVGVRVCATPTFMFLAVPSSSEGTGVIDVIRIDGGYTRLDTNPFEPGIQSIPCEGAQVVMNYWRQ